MKSLYSQFFTASLLASMLQPRSVISQAKGTSPEHLVKHEAAELLDIYDFVIAGGGTTGLTIADRLSEAFPESMYSPRRHTNPNTTPSNTPPPETILVIEHGDLEPAPGVFDPPTREWSPVDAGAPRASAWDLTSLPSPALNNQSASIKAGRVVGGSSAINGMFFDRGSRFDFDAWDRLQSTTNRPRGPEWNWDGIYPFFKKSVSFTPPWGGLAGRYGFTWDLKAWGGLKGPIYATMASFLWGDHVIVRRAWEKMGIWTSRECAGGDKEGLCWVPNSQDPATGRRSYAGSGHYADVVRDGNRENYHLLVRHQVVRVVWPEVHVGKGGLGKSGSGRPPVVEVRSVGNATQASGRVFNVTVKGEVVISAGAFGSPAILQRSGIGPREFLDRLGIPTVLDLPGVGSNLQDHSGQSVEWNYSRPLGIHPMPLDMADDAFFAEAVAGWKARPARGPYTIALSMSSIWVPLPNITTNYSAIIDKIQALADVESGGGHVSDLLHLPPSYGSSPELIAGYRAQLEAIADLLANPKAPSLESAFTTGTNIVPVLLHPLSRGTVRLNPSAPLGLPVLDYRSASNPIDIDLYVAHARYLRRTVAAIKTIRDASLGLTDDLVITETEPGEGVESDEDLVKWIRQNTLQSFMHPCCTNAMMPEGKGGVVKTDLKVHGAGGRLRVADASIFPIQVSSHLSALCYAVGEKVSVSISWSKALHGKTH